MMRTAGRSSGRATAATHWVIWPWLAAVALGCVDGARVASRPPLQPDGQVEPLVDLGPEPWPDAALDRTDLDVPALDAARPRPDLGVTDQGYPTDEGLPDRGRPAEPDLDPRPPVDLGFPPRPDTGPDPLADAGFPPDEEDIGQLVEPEHCVLPYIDEFPQAPRLPRRSMPVRPFREPDPMDLDPLRPARLAHTEPAPPSYSQLLLARPNGWKSIVMPDYDDNLPRFERAQAWATPTRCYETPAGPVLLTEEEAYDLYRTIAEQTTGVPLVTAPEVRSVVGLRGAYPGTFLWHGNDPDRFNDTLVLLWQEEGGRKHVREFPVNTDTGARDFGVDSSSSLRPNRRYRYVNGWHRDYHALRIDEIGYRVRDDTNHNGHWDSDRNGWLAPLDAEDHDRTGSGHNIHMGSVDRPLGRARVNGWSAGCQVIPGMANWTEFITNAWTDEGDRVNYFLVDVRDIPATVWQPCAPDGSHACPFVVAGFPFSARPDTSRGGFSVFDVYNCSPADESGPEYVYAFTLDLSGTLAVAIDCVEPIDLDIYLLEGDDPQACLTRAHRSFEYAITPGRYLVVVDTFVENGEVLAGACDLNLSLR